MNTSLLHWAVYEITTNGSPIHGVMFRGRIRKLGIEKGINVLVENAADKENAVRFAVLSEQDADVVTEYVHHALGDASVSLVLEGVANPVLSKIKVNEEARYQL